jgi:nitrate reductase NapAB chaperone NapD
MSHLCISSLVVQTQPSLLADVRNRLNALSEAEVLGENNEGKLVVVLDTASNREAANLITDIQHQAGVLSATLIYQYDDQFEPQVEDAA